MPTTRTTLATEVLVEQPVPAYKVGQREITRARREVAERMGHRFDLGVFHHEVLGHGTLPLTIFRREIPGWVEAATPRRTAQGGERRCGEPGERRPEQGRPRGVRG
jgi:hypothetical protein